MTYVGWLGAAGTFLTLGADGESIAKCPRGEFVIGGGYDSNGHTTAIINEPPEDGSGWHVYAFKSNCP